MNETITISKELYEKYKQYADECSCTIEDLLEECWNEYLSQD